MDTDDELDVMELLVKIMVGVALILVVFFMSQLSGDDQEQDSNVVEFERASEENFCEGHDKMVFRTDGQTKGYRDCENKKSVYYTK